MATWNGRVPFWDTLDEEEKVRVMSRVAMFLLAMILIYFFCERLQERGTLTKKSPLKKECDSF